MELNGRKVMWIAVLIGLLSSAIVALVAGRRLDRRADAEAWNELAATAGGGVATFDPATVSELPEPARRYFNFMIEPGAPLHTVVELDMTGHIALGTPQNPHYRPMQASQILAPPHGLVWQLEAGAISGSDGARIWDACIGR